MSVFAGLSVLIYIICGILIVGLVFSCLVFIMLSREIFKNVKEISDENKE